MRAAVRCRRCRRRHGCCRRPAADDEARAGRNPLRVVLDPSRRLGDHYKVFTDDSADTLYVCATSALADGERHVGQAPIEPAPLTRQTGWISARCWSCCGSAAVIASSSKAAA